MDFDAWEIWSCEEKVWEIGIEGIGKDGDDKWVGCEDEDIKGVGCEDDGGLGPSKDGNGFIIGNDTWVGFGEDEEVMELGREIE